MYFNKYLRDKTSIRIYLGVLPIKFLYKKVEIFFIFKNVIKGEKGKLYDGKWDCKLYNIPLKYTSKVFDNSFVNYLGPVYIKSMQFFYKKNVYSTYTKNNPNKILYNWLFSELV